MILAMFHTENDALRFIDGGTRKFFEAETAPVIRDSIAESEVEEIGIKRYFLIQKFGKKTFSWHRML